MRLSTELARLPQEAPDAEVMRALRELRQREWCASHGAILRDGRTSKSRSAISHLADVCIRFAYERALTQFAARFGTPLRSDGSPQSLVIIAMGKLGGARAQLLLRYRSRAAVSRRTARPRGSAASSTPSSFCVCAEDGPAARGAEADGFVYRVDLRLRPFGDSGPLAMCFAAFEHYLQQHGRDWERYAYVKARAVTGSSAIASSTTKCCGRSCIAAISTSACSSRCVT